MSKNIFPDNTVETNIIAQKTSCKRNTLNVWSAYGYFKQEPCDFGIDVENFSENFIIYDQGYQLVKDNKKIYYAEYFLIEQVNECLNLPEDLQNHKCHDMEVIMYRPRYDSVTGTFLGLYETIGYIMVRGDPEEHFLAYGYNKQNSKILHSHYKK